MAWVLHRNRTEDAVPGTVETHLNFFTDVDPAVLLDPYGGVEPFDDQGSRLGRDLSRKK
ncbi:MAG: hypothetical protein O2992_02000 [Gemmatimonadetes bacterium]|nr:hypothetical protein [Gemmatimonadota bacterium]